MGLKSPYGAILGAPEVLITGPQRSEISKKGEGGVVHHFKPTNSKDPFNLIIIKHNFSNSQLRCNIFLRHKIDWGLVVI